MEELRLMMARDVVISSNVPVRADGQPYAARRIITDPGVAVYFTLRGKPLVMARDAFWRPEDNLRSICLTIRALRAIERNGGAFMMSRAFDGFTSLPPPESQASTPGWASTLGVPPHATEEEIMARWRELAKKHHPDNGGSDAMMAELNRAKDQALRAARKQA